MGLFKALFGGKQADTEEKKTNDEARDFDMYKFDGVKASKMGQFEYAVKCIMSAHKNPTFCTTAPHNANISKCATENA